MKSGDIFIPYKQFRGSFIPNWLICRPTNEISQGAKLCYARLTQFSGKDGRCYPSYETIGREIGVGRRMAIRYIAELEACKLIRLVQSVGEENHYVFLWHDWADSDQCLDFKTPVYDSEPTDESCSSMGEQSFTGGVNDSTLVGVNNRSQTAPPSNIEEKNQLKRIKEAKGVAVSFLSLGSQIDTPEFWQSWSDWIQHRKERRRPLTSQTIKRQIQMLEKMPAQTAIRCIETSLQKGWEGLFEPEEINGKSSKPHKPRQDELI